MSGVIICGVDDSESAKGAARVARALSTELGVGVTFVRVLEPGAPEAKMGAIAARLERLSAAANRSDGGASWSIGVGHPADGLVAAAKKAEASMIVVGSTGPHSSLLGSVSADVSRRAPCPVVVVPPGADRSTNGRADRVDGDAMGVDGGIARFGQGGRGVDLAGGVARFGFGSGASGG